MVKLFRALVFRHRLKKQIRLADERKRRTGKKQFVIPGSCPCLNMQFVINLGGRPLCVSKEHIRRLAAERFYRPGVTVADIAAAAIYKTN